MIKSRNTQFTHYHTYQEAKCRCKKLKKFNFLLVPRWILKTNTSLLSYFVVNDVIVYFLPLFTFCYHFLSLSCYWRHLYPTFTLPYLILYLISYLTFRYRTSYLTLAGILPSLTFCLTLPYILPYVLPCLTLPYLLLVMCD